MAVGALSLVIFIVGIKACNNVGEVVTSAGGSTFMASVEKKVADDAVTQYEIANRSGTRMDACVHAGFVSAAFIQAKDEPSYQKWKAIEKKDCGRAGIPQ